MEGVEARPVLGGLRGRGLVVALLSVAFALAAVAPAHADDLALPAVPVATPVVAPVEAVEAVEDPVAQAAQQVQAVAPVVATPEVSTAIPAVPQPATLPAAPSPPAVAAPELSPDISPVVAVVAPLDTAVDTAADTAADTAGDIVSPVASPVVEISDTAVKSATSVVRPATQAVKDAPAALAPLGPPGASTGGPQGPLPETPAAFELSETLVSQTDAPATDERGPSRVLVSGPGSAVLRGLRAPSDYLSPSSGTQFRLDASFSWPLQSQPVVAEAKRTVEAAGRGPAGPGDQPLPAAPPVPAAAVAPPALLLYDDLALLLATLALLGYYLGRRARDRPDRAIATLRSLSLECPG